LVGVFWTKDQLIAKTSNLKHETHIRQTSVTPSGIEPAISLGKRPQNYALDCAATETGGLLRAKIHICETAGREE